jgi:hypothetical protein
MSFFRNFAQQALEDTTQPQQSGTDASQSGSADQYGAFEGEAEKALEGAAVGYAEQQFGGQGGQGQQGAQVCSNFTRLILG